MMIFVFFLVHLTQLVPNPSLDKPFDVIFISVFISSIKSVQRALITGDLIAKGGHLNTSSADEFAPIIFDDQNIDISFNDSVGDVVHCTVPWRMHVDIMYTR